MPPSHLNANDTSLHEYALRLAREHRRTEGLLLKALDDIDSCRLYRALGYPSLFAYAVSALGLSEGVAYAMITVARKARDLALLREAVLSQELTVSKAAKIVAVLDQDNATEMIAFAKTRTSREIEAEVAKRRHASGAKERLRNLPIPASLFEKLKRAQSVLATQRGQNVDQVAALEAALDEFLDRHDPVRRADRAMKRKQNAKTSAAEPTHSSREERKRKTAAEIHAVNARDRGRCQFVDTNGKCCENDRWLHHHHKIPVSRGGSNDPANLVSLCPFHHDLVHQLGFAIDGQVNWLKRAGASLSLTGLCDSDGRAS